MENTSKKLIRLLTLHRYWIWSNAMRIKFYESLENITPTTSAVELYVNETGMYMSYWYSSLYVVIEEYRQTDLTNKDVDALISDQTKIENLRLFRNATFHFQEDYFSEKFAKFISDKNSASWCVQLTEKIGEFIKSELSKITS